MWRQARIAPATGGVDAVVAPRAEVERREGAFAEARVLALVSKDRTDSIGALLDPLKLTARGHAPDGPKAGVSP